MNRTKPRPGVRGAAFVKSGGFFIEYPSEGFRWKPDYEVKLMLAIAKFGGSSLSCAAAWRQVREIVTGDIARRVIVVSAAGKRHADDHKITDLLYLCHAHLRYGVPCWELWRKIAGRYLAIRDECAINFPIEDELDAIYENLSPQTSADFLASRGENLSAKLMAAYLGFSFVDAASWLQFDYAGNVLTDSSYAALSSLADGRKIVTPGFYGALPDGRIHTFSRGGSDITGSLAAAALHADVYENWTDVPGILTADPRIVKIQRQLPRSATRSCSFCRAPERRCCMRAQLRLFAPHRFRCKSSQPSRRSFPAHALALKPVSVWRKRAWSALRDGGQYRCCAFCSGRRRARTQTPLCAHVLRSAVWKCSTTRRAWRGCACC